MSYCSYSNGYWSFRFFRDKDGVLRCRLHPTARVIDHCCEECVEIEENVQITDHLPSPGRFYHKWDQPELPRKARRRKVLKCHYKHDEQEKREVKMWRTRPYRKAELKRKKEK